MAPIDAARGCAMVLVCLSHVRHYFADSAPLLNLVLESVTRIATPTFLLLSGFVVGHLLRTDPRGNAGITLVDRGLFLITVAHVLLALVEVVRAGELSAWLFAGTEITDVIGLALLLAVALRSASSEALLSIGGLLCVGSWFIAMTLRVEGGWQEVLASLLFFAQSVPYSVIEAPLVAYMGVFLLGMGLSARLRPLLLARADAVIARRLILIGGGALVVVGAGILAWHYGKHHLGAELQHPLIAEVLRGALDPRRKWPPSPAYVLFYGGLGLTLAGLLFGGRPSGLVAPVVRLASVIGRASLMCWIAQDFLINGLPTLGGFAGVESVPFWLAYFVACVLLLYVLSRGWNAVRGNRFLTVGVGRLLRERPSAQTA